MQLATAMTLLHLWMQSSVLIHPIPYLILLRTQLSLNLSCCLPWCGEQSLNLARLRGWGGEARQYRGGRGGHTNYRLPTQRHCHLVSTLLSPQRRASIQRSGLPWTMIHEHWDYHVHISFGGIRRSLGITRIDVWQCQARCRHASGQLGTGSGLVCRQEEPGQRGHPSWGVGRWDEV